MEGNYKRNNGLQMYILSGMGAAYKKGESGCTDQDEGGGYYC